MLGVEVAKLFDELLLMTANPGRAVYNGKMEEFPRRCHEGWGSGGHLEARPNNYWGSPHFGNSKWA